MLKQELIDKIAREVFVTPDQAMRMLDIIERTGWKSPEEVRQGKEMVREAFRFPAVIVYIGGFNEEVSDNIC